MRRERKELFTLKRENQRLRKELTRQQNTQWEADPEDNAGQEVELVREPSRRVSKGDSEKKPAGNCPKCRSDMEYVEFGSFTYRFCSDQVKCKNRIKMK